MPSLRDPIAAPNTHKYLDGLYLGLSPRLWGKFSLGEKPILGAVGDALVHELFTLGWFARARSGGPRVACFVRIQKQNVFRRQALVLGTAVSSISPRPRRNLEPRISIVWFLPLGFAGLHSRSRETASCCRRTTDATTVRRYRLLAQLRVEDTPGYYRCTHSTLMLLLSAPLRLPPEKPAREQSGNAPLCYSAEGPHGGGPDESTPRTLAPAPPAPPPPQLSPQSTLTTTSPKRGCTE